MSFFKLSILLLLLLTSLGCRHTDHRSVASNEECDEVCLEEISGKNATKDSHMSEALNKSFEKFWYAVYHEKSDKKHDPTFLHHHKRTTQSALVIPGSFESPAHFQTMTQYFYKTKKLNTLTVSLPGFWDKKMENVREVKYSEWIDYLDRSVEFLSSISDEIVVYGHSLGGLLAIHLAEKYPNKVKMVFLSSPAIEATNIIKAMSIAGNALAKVGYHKNGSLPDADGIDIPMQSGNIGSQISKLAKHKGIFPLKAKFIESYNVPTFMIMPEDDKVIKSKTVVKVLSKINAPKKLIVLKEIKGVNHRSMIKSSLDMCIDVRENCWENLDTESALDEVDKFYSTHN